MKAGLTTFADGLICDLKAGQDDSRILKNLNHQGSNGVVD